MSIVNALEVAKGAAAQFGNYDEASRLKGEIAAWEARTVEEAMAVEAVAKKAKRGLWGLEPAAPMAEPK